MKPTRVKNNSLKIAAVFLSVGVVLLAYAILFEMQIAAFVGLGLTFWGAVFSLARSRKHVDSSLLDGTAKSSYSTIDRMINDLKYNGRGYFIPAYPRDVFLPEYLQNLREPVVFISESFDGKPSIEELAEGKFLSAKANGVFITSPGAGILSQMEKQVQLDFSKIDLQELAQIVPSCLTGTFNLVRNADMTILGDEVGFRAVGNLYESLYRSAPPLKSVNLLGCPVVSAVASAVAKTSGKTVIIKEQVLSPGNCGVHVIFGFI
ncbi:MAG: hypothetical protein NWE98_02790 [Candidatus Bathyarchaeota archaeon]|nr:hypothetical protein [Candidatus Bathyarchaeota archaeon]